MTKNGISINTDAFNDLSKAVDDMVKHMDKITTEVLNDALKNGSCCYKISAGPNDGPVSRAQQFARWCKEYDEKKQEEPGPVHRDQLIEALDKQWERKWNFAENAAITALTNSYKELERKLDIETKNHTALSKSYQAVVERNKQLRDRIKVLEQEAKESSNIFQFKAINDNLKKQLQDAKDSLQNCYDVIDRSNKESEELRNKLQASESMCTAYRLEIKDLKERLDKTKEELAEARRMAWLTDKEIKELQSQKQTLSQKLTTAEQFNKTLQTEKANLLNMIIKQRMVIRALKEAPVNGRY